MAHNLFWRKKCSCKDMSMSTHIGNPLSKKAQLLSVSVHFIMQQSVWPFLWNTRRIFGPPCRMYKTLKLNVCTLPFSLVWVLLFRYNCFSGRFCAVEGFLPGMSLEKKHREKDVSSLPYKIRREHKWRNWSSLSDGLNCQDDSISCKYFSSAHANAHKKICWFSGSRCKSIQT